MAKTSLVRGPVASLLVALLFGGAVGTGCGDADKGAAPSGAPASSLAPPVTAASGGPAAPMDGAKRDEKAAALPAPTTSAPPVTAEKPAVGPGPAGGPYERASLLAYLPTECPEGRAYVDVQKALGGDGGAVKDLVEKLVASSKDKAKADAVMKALRDGGLDPSTSVREIAACVLAGKQPLVAFGLDASKSKDPTATLFAALQAGEGQQKVSLVDEQGMKVIKNPRGEVMTMVAPNVLVLAKTVDRLKDAAKAPGGTAGFADAPAHVLWMRLTGRENVDVSVAEKASEYELTALFPPNGPMIAKIKTDPKGTAEAYEKEAKKRAAQLEGSPLKGLASAVKAAQWSTEGDRVKVHAKAAQSVVVDTVKVILSTPEQQLFGALQ